MEFLRFPGKSPPERSQPFFSDTLFTLSPAASSLLPISAIGPLPSRKCLAGGAFWVRGDRWCGTTTLIRCFFRLLFRRIRACVDYFPRRAGASHLQFSARLPRTSGDR